LDQAGLSLAERLLLDYVKLITDAAYRSTADDVQRLRDAGWKENEIAEAVYITAMFAFFNRVADAFGVPAQNYLETGKMTP
jgi:alkylhydroperoxidase family enzyme